MRNSYMQGLALSFIIIFSLSCSKIGNLITFKVHDSASFTVSSMSGLNLPVNIPIPTTKASFSKAFENNKTKASLVKNVIINSLNLQIQNPSNKSFSFLKSIEIYIDADGAEEIMLANLYDIPVSVGNTLNLEVTGSHLDPYIKSESYTLRTVVAIRELLNENVDIKANMEFTVAANTL